MPHFAAKSVGAFRCPPSIPAGARVIPLLNQTPRRDGRLSALVEQDTAGLSRTAFEQPPVLRRLFAFKALRHRQSHLARAVGANRFPLRRGGVPVNTPLLYGRYTRRYPVDCEFNLYPFASNPKLVERRTNPFSKFIEGIEVES